MTTVETETRDAGARHRGRPEQAWWLQPSTDGGRHLADTLCPSEDERRRSEVEQRQLHRL